LPTESPPILEPLFTRRFGWLFAAHFLQAFGFGSLFLLPLFLEHIGATKLEIGSIMAVQGVGALVVRPLVAWSLDNLGRKTTLYAGTALITLGLVMVAFIEDTGPYAYVSRVVFGMGTGALFPGYFAFASDIIPASRRTEGIAIFGLGGLLPLAFNPLIPRLGIDAAGLSGFFPIIGLVVACSVFFLIPIAETPLQKNTDGTSFWRSLKHLTKPAVWPVWFATIVFAGMLAVFASFVTVLANQRGVSDPTAIWFTYAAGAACVRLLGAKLPDRVGPSNMVTPSVAFYVIGIVVVAQATTTEQFMIGGLLTGLGHGYCFPVLTAQVINRVPTQIRGSGLAFSTGLFELSGLTLTPLFGAFADSTSLPAMFLLVALSATIGTMGWFWLESRWGNTGRGKPN
jgi:MFS family permease